MFSLRYGKRPVIEESQKISASICVRNYLFERPISIISHKIDLNNEQDVKDLISEIESGTTFNLKQQNGSDNDYTEPNMVKLTHSKSNLGKGFIFWFICNLCSKRVKFLYFPPNSTVLACRNCHRLTYNKQNESKKYRPFRRLFGV
jgi:hypothetical protein